MRYSSFAHKLNSNLWMARYLVMSSTARKSLNSFNMTRRLKNAALVRGAAKDTRRGRNGHARPSSACLHRKTMEK